LESLPDDFRSNVNIARNDSIYSVIQECDLEISCETCTTAVESWMCGKPTIELIFEKHPMFYHDTIRGLNRECATADEIVATIQERSRSYKERKNDDDGGGERGGFLKIIDGKWNIVDGKLAKEKISQSLRDILAGQYCSSLVSKKKKRRESNLQRIVDFDKIVLSNKFVL
jgi:hypothetical protein